MRTLIQRVLNSKVEVEEKIVGEIKKGLLIFVGFENADEKKDLIWVINKIIGMRIFSDQNGKMNLSIKETNGEILVISQFTLYADVKKGNRPSFINAAEPLYAKKLYEEFINLLENTLNKKVQTGMFGADMKVHLINDGPVTIYFDTKN